ncbi:unnamed protein product [Caenorhabditis sp. 36 PRJEB53466]|nr:unnamed protein product [Caenorhabditis sp. 36 PRJEB53466]
MLALLAVSLAVTTVTAQYGASNDAPASSYPTGPIYAPPIVFDDRYWEFDSRERHHKKCPDLRTYLGTLPGIPEQAFYPPIIRYARFGRTLTALVVCDRDPKNTNVLFARRNETRDIRSARVAAFGTTAGLSLTCDRNERRYIGTVIDSTESDFSNDVKITQFTCLGLNNVPFVGLQVELTNKEIAQIISGVLAASGTRRKREAVEEATTEAVTDAATDAATDVTTDATTDAATDAATDVTTDVTTDAATDATTDAATNAATDAATDAPATAASIESIDLTDGLSKEEAALVKDPLTAVQVAIANIAKLLGRVL